MQRSLDVGGVHEEGLKASERVELFRGPENEELKQGCCAVQSLPKRGCATATVSAKLRNCTPVNKGR
jgi:hypothetical protein